MNVFELFAKIGLDTSEFDSGLSRAGSSMKSAGGVIGAGAVAVGNLVSTGITAGVNAVKGLASSAVSTGMSFDTAMAQVAATMGKTVEEISTEQGKAVVRGKEFEGSLMDYAKFVGQNTEYSASQAAEALNYMALAGYSAQQSMDMLPNVLNLASAGQMDMARASDMVTDAQTALGLSFEETSVMVDQMAKAAATTNTSVEQLGDAFLTVGANAKKMKGGTAEISQVLGLLADNGIKASEGGTHLRNILLKLGNESDTFKEMGVDIYDAEGKMRSLQDIFLDFNGALEGMGVTAGERDSIISDIFNVTDLASVNSLLDTTEDRWNAVADSIAGAEGSAEKMAQTQMDNLSGDMKLFQSALEAVHIAFSGSVTPDLREFVQIGTEGLSKVAEALEAGDMEGAIDAIADTITSLIDKFTEYLPQFMEAGGKILGALASGIMSNLPAIIDAAAGVIGQLAAGLAENADKILDGAIGILEALGRGIIDNLPIITDAVIKIIQAFADYISENASEMVAGAVAIVTALAGAVAEVLPVLAPAAVEIIVALVSALVENLPKVISFGAEIIGGIAEGINEALPGLAPVVAGIVTAFGGLSVALNAGKWINSLSTAIESANIGMQVYGKVTQGVIKAQELMNAVMALNPFVLVAIAIAALVAVLVVLWNTNEDFRNAVTSAWESIKNVVGGAVEAIGGFITGLWEGLKTIGTAIKDFFTMAFNGESIGDAFIIAIGENFGVYIPEAVEKAKDAISGFFTSIGEWVAETIPALVETIGAFFESLPEKIGYAIGTVIGTFANWVNSIGEWAAEAIPALIEGIATWFSELPGRIAQFLTDTVTKFREWRESVAAWAAEAIPALVENITSFFSELPGKIWEWLTQAIDKVKEFGSSLKEKAGQAGKDFLDALIKAVKDIPNKMREIGRNIVEGVWNGIKGAYENFKKNVSNFFGGIVSGVKDTMGIHSPSTVFAGIGKNLVLGLEEGWGSNINSALDYIQSGLDFSATMPEIEPLQIEGVGSLTPIQGTAQQAQGGNMNEGGGQPLTVILQLDKTELARTIYTLNRQETQRVGVSLAGGLA